jgi:RNA polymerase sigma-70 factor (ECF subfamily)
VDRGLVERAQDGDRDAYETLARAAATRLYQAAHRIVRDPDKADDAVQRTLIAIWQELPSLRDPDRFGAWTYRLLLRFCLADTRRARRVGVREIPLDELTPSAADSIAASDLRDAITRALEALSPEHRAVVVLHHHVGMPLATIAEVVGVPLGTVKSRLFHATRLLRTALGADTDTDVPEVRPA